MFDTSILEPEEDSYLRRKICEYFNCQDPNPTYLSDSTLGDKRVEVLDRVVASLEEAVGGGCCGGNSPPTGTFQSWYNLALQTISDNPDSLKTARSDEAEAKVFGY